MFNANTMVTIHKRKKIHTHPVDTQKIQKNQSTLLQKKLSDHKERQDKKKRTTKTENS